MLGTISAATLSTTPLAPASKPADTYAGESARSNRAQPPAAPSGESQQKQSDPKSAPPARTEQAPPPPAASTTPAPSTATLAAPPSDFVLVEDSASAPTPAVTDDGLADKRAALARITETAQGWNEVSTVLDGAAEFSARAAEESSEAPAPRDSAARTEDRARTFAAEEGYSASKTVFEGAAPEGDTAKAA